MKVISKLQYVKSVKNSHKWSELRSPHFVSYHLCQQQQVCEYQSNPVFSDNSFIKMETFHRKI